MTTPPHFTVPLAEPEEDEEPSCTFDLDGKTWRCKPHDRIPASVVTAVAQERPDVGFVMSCLLVEEDQEAFKTFLRDPNCPLTVGGMQKLLEWVVEQTLNRPITPLASSRQRSRRGGRTSQDASSSAASA